MGRVSLVVLSVLVGACSGDVGGGGGGGSDGGGGDVGTTTRCTIFPSDNPWNQDVSGLDVHPDSDAIIDSIGRTDTLHPDFGTEWQGEPIGIPYAVVPDSTQKVSVSFDYADESDPGPYPLPASVPIEAGSDAHVLVIDEDSCMLYELYAADHSGSTWSAGSGAIFDLSSNDLRPAGWTSADAAGLPIFPGLVRYDEVVGKGVIDHALRFTVSRSRSAYIAPARHAAGDGSSSSLPPMGLRLRMKASYDCSGYSSEVQVVCTALKKYGMFVADNGSDWYVSGAPDPRWNDDALGDMKQIPGDAFEVIYTGDPVAQ